MKKHPHALHRSASVFISLVFCLTAVQLEAEATDPVIGKWHGHWKDHRWGEGDFLFEFFADGRLAGDRSRTGSWGAASPGTAEQKYRLRWNDGVADSLTLSKDGNRLSGKNQNNSDLWAERIVEPPVGEAPDPVVGKWHWQSRSQVEFFADGRLAWAGTTAGSWGVTFPGTDEQRYVLSWSNGYIDSLTLSKDGNRLSGKNDRNGNVWAERVVEPDPTPAAVASASPNPFGSGPAASPSPTAEVSSELAAKTAELVRDYRNSLVVVKGRDGAGSGFLATMGDRVFLATNTHVVAGVKRPAFTALDGTNVKTGAASLAVGHDIFLMMTASAEKPWEIMKDVDKNAGIGDDIVVLGNAEGAGVINTITGKIVGIGPDRVEVNAPFVPGNSGSPIIHVKTGKVIGVATYLVVQNFDPATKEKVKEPIVRRFGYRLDSVKAWQPVNWAAFSMQASKMEEIETLTDALVDFLRDLAEDGLLTEGRHTHPVLKGRIDSWIEKRQRRLSIADIKQADANMLSFLKVASRNDVNAARAVISYDYFQRGLDTQQRIRTEIAEILTILINRMR